MPRQRPGQKPAARAAPAGARGASTYAPRPAARQAPPPPAPAHARSNVPAQQQQAATPAPVQTGSAAGGFMSNVASIAAGSVIGHGVSNMLFGGSSAATETAAAAPAAQQQYQEPNENDPCSFAAKDYASCMSNTQGMTGEGIESPCKYLFDQFTACQRRYGQQQL